MLSSTKLEKTQFMLKEEVKYIIDGFTFNLNSVT